MIGYTTKHILMFMYMYVNIYILYVCMYILTSLIGYTTKHILMYMYMYVNIYILYVCKYILTSLIGYTTIHILTFRAEEFHHSMFGVVRKPHLYICMYKYMCTYTQKYKYIIVCIHTSDTYMYKYIY